MCNFDPNLLSIGWPRIGPQPPDRNMVRTLFSLYAGPAGALTQITQYLYNVLLCTAAEQLEASDLFGSASRDCMFHLKRLGQMIAHYGGDPRFLNFQGNRPQWWTAGAVHYQQDLCAMLRRAIALTRQSITAYEDIAKRMEPEPRAVIQRILLDQNHYLDLFECMLREQNCVTG